MYKTFIKIKKNNQGLSLVEIMLVAVIFIVILSSVVALSGDKTPREDLQAQSQAAVDIISRAHNYAVTGYWGDNWGVKVLNASADCVDSGTGDCIIIYRGKTYASRDSSYDEILRFTSGGAYVEANNEFYFKKAAGWLATTTAGIFSDQAIVIKNNFNSQKTVTSTLTGLVYYGD